MLANVARVTARGGSVTVGALPEEITTTTAAFDELRRFEDEAGLVK